MELLYLWINRSARKVIEQQGFNFSPEFKFDMNYRNGTWELKENLNWRSKKSIFKSGVIEEVTAIVGENGSGKTTLLNYLFGLNCAVDAKDNLGEEYDELKQKRENDELCLFIMRQNDDVVIYHNFRRQFGNLTRYRVLDMTNTELYRNMLLGHNGFKNISKVYLSNSNYGTTGSISTDGKLDEIMLSPNSLSIISGSYFKKILNLEQRIFSNNVDYVYRNIIKKQKTSMNFQEICDIIYFAKLKRMGKLDSYFGKVSSTLGVFSDFCTSFIDKEYNYFHEEEFVFSERMENEEKLYGYYCQMKKQYKSFLISEEVLFRILWANLIFEICLDVGCDWPENIYDYTDLDNWIQSNGNGENKNYYIQAKQEIQGLKTILKGGKRYHNVVPKEDWAYKFDIILNYEESRDLYLEFLEYINKCFGKEHSFILRYLKIEGLGMSSGERAFQNFFSWINLLPQFHNIIADMAPDLKETVLLLIDELDLYLHPEWQVKFLKNMLMELETQFPKKKIQVVFTTHSPLCLSDIPNENTIYLSRRNDKTIAQNREEHLQTFGRDVYTLLNDSFYIKDCTMGTFAESFINNIMEKLYDKKEKKFKHLCEEEIAIIDEKINYIGNDILKKKLKEMLLNCIDQKEAKMKYLAGEKRKIEAQMAELEAKTW